MKRDIPDTSLGVFLIVAAMAVANALVFVHACRVPQ